MSVYELLNYDELLRQVGITPGEVWHCGANPPEEIGYDDAGVTYDGTSTYIGLGQKIGGGLCLSEDVNVNGLLLNHRDDNGTVWLCTGIEGWWTLPPSEIPDVPKPYWDGSLLTTGRYTPRTITVSGIFIPPDKSLVWYNRDALLRVSSIVRGIGLITLCGNESPTNTEMLDGTDADGKPISYRNNFYDPPKMAVIQTADVPLVDTSKPSGFTEFSLVFKCVQPTKVSVYEQNKVLPVSDGGLTRKRYYKAFSLTAAEDPGNPTTEYIELVQIAGSATKRHYSGVLNVNLDSLIADEELTESTSPDMSAYQSTAPVDLIVLHNSGNYFAFPVFVFGNINGADNTHTVTVHNVTTGESMSIQRNVAAGKQLIVDTNMRRVAVVDPLTSPDSWTWDDRGSLSLTSQWISLAPGDNTIITSKGAGVQFNEGLPQVFWRDTWVG